MRRIRFIIQKEFLQIFRNKGMLPIIFVMPVIQLIILTTAATFDLKNVRYNVVDADQSVSSRRLIEHFSSSGYFTLVGNFFSEEQAEKDLQTGQTTMILQIPLDFDKDLGRGQLTKLQFIINAEDGNMAGLTQSYAATIVRRFAETLRSEHAIYQSPSGIQITSSFWYNPELKYEDYMLPGILVVLVSMIGLFLSGMNIVREKEIGTIEQLNVTPIRKYEFMIGKLFPFGILGMFELGFGLVVGKLLFHLPTVGSLGLVFCCASVYLFVVLSMGLLISTITDTQQQAMFIAWFFMVIFMLMGGIFTPIESMPEWAQRTTWLNPVAQFIKIMRGVLLKGSTLHDVRVEFSLLCVFAVILMSLAVNRYRKYSV
ncbi:MAG: ABC transporter permease [Bacteroidetes bacterium]|nr:ABC transporter permease [Bacteroidota bacterium]